MKPLDDALRSALAADREEADTLRLAIASTFQRRTRFLTIITWTKMGLFAVCAALCAWFFFQATTTRAQIALATGFAVFALGNTALFTLYWMEVHRAWTARELKRIELQLARLGLPQGGTSREQ
jgi:hypothetical protein